MTKKRKAKCYPGEAEFLGEVERVDKSAQKIGATLIENVIDETGLTRKQVHDRYHCFCIDNQTYVYF